MTSYFCEWAWLGGDIATADVLIDVQGDRITDVSAGATRPADATFLSGLTLPGLANAHSHAFHRALRGRTHADGGTFWTWRDRMYELARTLDPQQYLDLATAVFGEMVMAGVTCVGEFHYLHHAAGGVGYSDPNEMSSALLEAASRAGLRMTLLDTCYLEGAPGRPLNDVQQRFSDGSVEAWCERVEQLSVPMHARLGAAVHSVRAVPPPAIADLAVWTSARDAVLHAHVSEQPAENQQCIAAYGGTPAEVLQRSGAITHRFTAVHATHLTEHDHVLLGAAAVCLCPTTERDLADGVGAAAAMRRAGTQLCVGSDSHAVIDLFEEARAIELDERLVGLERGVHRAEYLLEAATVNGHRSLGWHDAGRIAEGYRADLVTLRLDTVRMAGVSPDTMPAMAVYAGSACDVWHVVSDGRVVVDEGRHCSLNVAAALDTAIAAVWSHR